MKKIMVHDGIFHADDVTAVAVYQIFTKELTYVIRTRDEEKAISADLVFDVGNTYDGNKFFDHHQNNVPVYDNGIKYAAVGLVLDHVCHDKDLKEYILNHGLYAVMAKDNGQEIPEGVSDENPFNFVSSMNETWKGNLYGHRQDNLFKMAVEISAIIIQHQLEKHEAIKLVNEEIHDTNGARLTNHILYLAEFMPWQETVISYNKEHDNEDFRIELVVFRQKENDYRVQVVPKDFDTFESWVRLDKEKAEKFEELNFFHKAAFLAGFKTKEAAIAFAKQI